MVRDVHKVFGFLHEFSSPLWKPDGILTSGTIASIRACQDIVNVFQYICINLSISFAQPIFHIFHYIALNKTAQGIDPFSMMEGNLSAATTVIVEWIICIEEPTEWVSPLTLQKTTTSA